MVSMPLELLEDFLQELGVVRGKFQELEWYMIQQINHQLLLSGNNHEEPEPLH